MIIFVRCFPGFFEPVDYIITILILTCKVFFKKNF
uniref:Uncharacterized protein n=1 Tax=Melanothamnus harveyi TaxID=397005 RepID=A0A1Z1MIA7_MELHR|nr:hypothetical protein [Melanothamnus harveyi]ARW65481.1 hypothetical protein [Melanothamnus harveyi]